MTQIKLENTVTRLSIKSAYKQWTHEDLSEDAPDAELDDIAQTLDAALTKAYSLGKVHEVLDTTMSDQVTYLAKLSIPNRGVLIGVVTDKNVQKRAFERRWSGESGKILVMVCSLGHTAARFRDGRWKSVDGKPVLGNLDEESQRVAGLKKCVVCERWKTVVDDYYFVSGKPRKQCKDCYKEYFKQYRASKRGKETGVTHVDQDGNSVCLSELLAQQESVDLQEHMAMHTSSPTGFTNVVANNPTSLGNVWTGVTRPVDVISELRALFELETQQLKDLDLATGLLAGTRSRISMLVGGAGVPG